MTGRSIRAWRRWTVGVLALGILAGCTTWEEHRAAVERECRQQAKNKPSRYEACLRKAAAADRERERRQDENWYESIDDASRIYVPLPAPHMPIRPHG